MLRKFHYRLAKLLKIREFKSKESQRDLGQCLDILQTRVNDLNNLGESNSREKALLQHQLHKPHVQIDAIIMSLRFLEANQSEILTCNEDIRALEKDVDLKRKLLIEAMIEEKKLKRHRETAFEKYDKEQNREINKQIDETASRKRNTAIGENVLSSGK